MESSESLESEDSYESYKSYKFLCEIDLRSVIVKVIFDICEENILHDLHPKYKTILYDCPYCRSNVPAEMTNISRDDYYENRDFYNSNGIVDLSDYAHIGKYLWKVNCKKTATFYVSTGDLSFPDECYYEYEKNPLLKLTNDYMRYLDGDISYEKFIDEHINTMPLARQ